jgi:SPP1 gp7 family putative phage head morphogenesis protein
VTPLERAAILQRAELQARENATMGSIVALYRRVQARLQANLDALTADMQQAEQAGVEVRPGWLFAQQRYHDLIRDLDDEVTRFAVASAKPITAGQDTAVQMAFEHGQRLVELALGPAPKTAVASVTANLGRLPAGALGRLVGRASNGQPLGVLLARIAPTATERVTDALAFGVAAGRNPRLIAREVQAAAGVSLTRATTIARTETIGAYRQASTDTYRASRVVTAQVWHAQLDTRTCPVCWAMNGQEFPAGTSMETHPNCRCAWLPATLSWAQLGFAGIPDRRPKVTTGAEAFRRLPEADKLVILGRARLDAYNAGDITLSDLVRQTSSPMWGGGRRVATVRELSL